MADSRKAEVVRELMHLALESNQVGGERSGGRGACGQHGNEEQKEGARGHGVVSCRPLVQVVR